MINLFIFCENRIFKLTGSALADFAVEPVTRNIGCVNGNTIQEFAGDLIFLGPDGLRTVAATARIGDVELGTISRTCSLYLMRTLETLAFLKALLYQIKHSIEYFLQKTGISSKNKRCYMCYER